MSDLTHWLKEWPWRPGRLDVRRIQASDGRLVLQVRVELGMLQLEADGRPDGGDFRQATTALDWFRGQPDADVDAEGVAALSMRLDPPVVRRQDAPAMFDITTVAYAARAGFVRRASGVFDGRVVTSVVPHERALDIDTEYDWMMAECLMARRDGRE